MSSVVKNEKEMLCTAEGIDWEIFMVSRPELKPRTPNGFEAWQLDFCAAQIPNFPAERVDRKETRDHVSRITLRTPARPRGLTFDI